MGVDVARLNAPVQDVEDALTREYPPVTSAPCRDCPWRRSAAPGWLGPYTAHDWVDAAHGETPIACHLTIPPGGGWGPLTRQCAGAATFRGNVCKSPINPSIAAGPVDRDDVFASSAEFVQHHAR